MAVGIDLPLLPPLNLQQVNTGLQPDDNLGDTWFEAFAKHNENMEILALFSNQTQGQFLEFMRLLTEVNGRLGSIESRLNALEDWRDSLATLQGILDDILRRLDALERRVSVIPEPVVSLPDGDTKPYAVLGFGAPNTTNAKVISFGTSLSQDTTDALGMYTGVPILRGHLSGVGDGAGGTQLADTTGKATYTLTFSSNVKAEAITSSAFINANPVSGEASLTSGPATFTITPYDSTGALIAEWSAAVTYSKDRIATKVGTGDWYKSLQGSNLNKALTDASWWSATSKRAFKYQVEITNIKNAASGTKNLILEVPTVTVIAENVDGTGRKAVVPITSVNTLAVVKA